MLHLIQQDLQRLYDIDHRLEIGDFVCDEAAARLVVGDAVERGEVVWVREHNDEIALGLFIAPDALSALLQLANHMHWRQEAFWAWSLATEGVSHLLYLHYKACAGESVSLLELELQAEIDKYVLGLMHGPDDTALVHRSAALRQQLFENTQYLDAPNTEAGVRYRLASRAAAMYTLALERECLARSALGAFAASLRRFYRLGGNAKLRQCSRPLR